MGQYRVMLLCCPMGWHDCSGLLAMVCFSPQDYQRNSEEKMSESPREYIVKRELIFFMSVNSMIWLEEIIPEPNPGTRS